MLRTTRSLWFPVASLALVLSLTQVGTVHAQFGGSKKSLTQPRSFPAPGFPNRDIELDPRIQTRRMPTSQPQPDRRAEALGLAAGIVGLVQTTVANRPQPQAVPETVQYYPQSVQYEPQTVQYVPQTMQPSVAQEAIRSSPPPLVNPSVETTVKIKNLTEKSQSNSVRRAGSQWGKYTLAAGAEHKFVIPAEELEVHYLTGVGTETATISVPGKLPAGLHFITAASIVAESKTAEKHPGSVPDR